MKDQLPSTVGTYQGKTYASGFYDVALTMYSRKSVLKKYGIRVPTLDKPWTKTEFGDALYLFALLVLPIALFIGVATSIRIIDARSRTSGSCPA